MLLLPMEWFAKGEGDIPGFRPHERRTVSAYFRDNHRGFELPGDPGNVRITGNDRLVASDVFPGMPSVLAG